MFPGALALLVRVHGGVGGVLQSFLVGAVFGIDGEADAGGALDEIAIKLEGLVEAAVEDANKAGESNRNEPKCN